ncbi:hypothetical protein [Tolypothrix sp. FACHB-123]|uniref:hypothetical protein n=1 Tax=Tolypothrix sp. FACHB-123 TaxID=2692868 RepID=UPI001F54BD4E|nr:hypothetical protein [Tolypothrix sp. FACHB-123]
MNILILVTQQSYRGIWFATTRRESWNVDFMSKDRKTIAQEDLQSRIDKVIDMLEHLEFEVAAIHNSMPVAPPSCRIARYLAKGRKEFYWYYKLHATTPIFPTRSDGKLSKYKHLGKAGSQAYIDAIAQITARTKIEALDRSIETLKQGLKDLVEETSKYNKQ